MYVVSFQKIDISLDNGRGQNTKQRKKRFSNLTATSKANDIARHRRVNARKVIYVIQQLLGQILSRT